jgi:dienelactone hydrolase
MSRFRRLGGAVAAVALAVTLVPLGANAGTLVTPNPYERGPAPTADLVSGPGPYEVASIARTAAQTGPGIAAGTIYYPADATGTVGAIAILPGWTNTQSAVAWYGPLLASHGFVAMTMNTNSPLFDFPAQRATQFLLTLDYLTSESNPVQDLVDPDRLAVMGYSMGGGGAIEATSRRTSIKASIPLTPWHTTKSFPNVETPTLIIGAQNDGTAPVATHAQPLYNNLSDQIDKAYAEVRGAPHSLPTSYNAVVASHVVTWMKRFVDNDYRYDPFLCPHPDDTVTYSMYESTCNYTPDSDGDGVSDPYDHCPDSVLPDELLPLPNPRAGAARADRLTVNPDGQFVSGDGVDSGVTIADTGGCSAMQIIDGLELGEGHKVFGITPEMLDAWLEQFSEAA